jgi:hypothetical protein
MTRWPRGEAEVEDLLRGGQLQQVTGAQTDGQPFLDKARRVLTTATSLVAADPESAYVLAYDAARHAATALLAHQGLRATSKGGHYAVDLTLRAQFGTGFRSFSALRRRRNELEYPENPAETIDTDEAQQAVTDAGALIDAATRLLPTIGRWNR